MVPLARIDSRCYKDNVLVLCCPRRLHCSSKSLQRPLGREPVRAVVSIRGDVYHPCGGVGVTPVLDFLSIIHTVPVRVCAEDVRIFLGQSVKRVVSVYAVGMDNSRVQKRVESHQEFFAVCNPVTVDVCR